MEIAVRRCYARGGCRNIHHDTPTMANKTLIGTLIGDRYLLESELGAGGFGTAYLASDRQLHRRKVVVKIPHAEMLLDEGFVRRFELEVRSLVTLEHPNIVNVLDGGTWNGNPYVVLRFLGGGSLQQILDARGGKLSAAEVLEWLPAVAEALDYIHSQGVLHRDVKPGNVLFDEHGRVYLADFGIAKVMAGSEARGSMMMTSTGRLCGSPRYMPPETATSTTPGPPYDQYALGTVVYQALSGAFAHGGEDNPLALLMQKVTVPPRDLGPLAPEVPAAAASAVMKSISTEPDARFRNCEEFAGAFAAGLKKTGSEKEIMTGTMPGAVAETQPHGGSQVDKAPDSDEPLAFHEPGEADAAPEADAVPVDVAPGMDHDLAVTEVVESDQDAAANTGEAVDADSVVSRLQLDESPSAGRRTASPSVAEPITVRHVRNTGPLPKSWIGVGLAVLVVSAFVMWTFVGSRRSGTEPDASRQARVAELQAGSPVVASDLGTLGCSTADECREVGRQHLFGENGREQSDEWARAYFEVACASASPAGCNRLALMQEFGRGGLLPDDPRVAELFTRACDGGLALGCANLGAMYEDGRGVEQDSQRAEDLYRQACDGGEDTGCTGLARIRPTIGSAGVAARTASLEIRSNVADDEVLLDGRLLGATPQRLQLEPGVYLVQVRKEGCEPAVRSVELTAGAGETWRASLECAEPAVAPGGGALRAGADIEEPTRVRFVPPEYPEVARQQRVQGVVILETTIDRQGNVSAVRVLRGIPLVDEAALEAVRQWRYTPTLVDGEPVEVLLTVSVNFALTRAPPAEVGADRGRLEELASLPLSSIDLSWRVDLESTGSGTVYGTAESLRSGRRPLAVVLEDEAYTFPAEYLDGLVRMLVGGGANVLVVPFSLPVSAFSPGISAGVRLEDLATDGYDKLMAGVDSAIRRGFVSEDRLGLIGWGYGGYMALWVITHTDRFSAAVTIAGTADVRSLHSGRGELPFADNSRAPLSRDAAARFSPISYANNAVTPLLVLHPARSRSIDIRLLERLADGLTSRGVDAEIVRLGEEYAVTRADTARDIIFRTARWLATRLELTIPS